MFHTVIASDVGKSTLHLFGRVWLMSNHVGPLQSIDIGKRIYPIGLNDPDAYKHLQMENDSQLNTRLAP